MPAVCSMGAQPRQFAKDEVKWWSEDQRKVQRLVEQLPPGPRICILGNIVCNDRGSEPLVAAIAAEIAKCLEGRVTVLTGGMPGVHEAFAKGLREFPALVNIIPPRQESSFSAGFDLTAGADFAE